MDNFEQPLFAESLAQLQSNVQELIQLMLTIVYKVDDLYPSVPLQITKHSKH